MKLITNFLPPQETLITDEAKVALANIISDIQLGITDSWKSLPKGIQEIIDSVTIEPDLHENLPDQIKIELTIRKDYFGLHPQISVKETCVTSLTTCLEPDIKNMVEASFKKMIFVFVGQLRENLQEFSKSLAGTPSE